MGYLIAYLLLVLAIDLLRELVNPTPSEDSATAVRRRLWSDTDFDCQTKVFAVEASTRRKAVRTPRNSRRSLWSQSESWLARVCSRFHCRYDGSKNAINVIIDQARRNGVIEETKKLNRNDPSNSERHHLRRSRNQPVLNTALM